MILTGKSQYGLPDSFESPTQVLDFLELLVVVKLLRSLSCLKLQKKIEIASI